MNLRDLHLLELRPEIPSARVTENMTADERFQNETLRPVAKLQDELLVATFRNYVTKHKNAFYELNLEKKAEVYRKCYSEGHQIPKQPERNDHWPVHYS